MYYISNKFIWIPIQTFNKQFSILFATSIDMQILNSNVKDILN